MSFLGSFYSSTHDASFSNPEPTGQDASTWSKYPATQNVDMANFNLDNVNIINATTKNVNNLSVTNSADISGVLIENGQIYNTTSITFSNSSFPTNPRIDSRGQGVGQGIIYVRDSTDLEGKLRIGNNGSNTGIALLTTDQGLSGYIAVRDNATGTFPLVVDPSQSDIVSVDANLSVSQVIKTNEIDVAPDKKIRLGTTGIDAGITLDSDPTGKIGRLNIRNNLTSLFTIAAPDIDGVSFKLTDGDALFEDNVNILDNITIGGSANITSDLKCDKLIFQQRGQIEGKSIPVDGGTQGAFLTTSSATNGVWLPSTAHARYGTLFAGGVVLAVKSINTNAVIIGASTNTNDITFEQRQPDEPGTLSHIYLINNGAVFTQYLFQFVDTSGNVITSQGGSNTIVKMYNAGPVAFTTHPGAVLVGLQPGEAQLVEVMVVNNTTLKYPMIVNVSF